MTTVAFVTETAPVLAAALIPAALLVAFVVRHRWSLVLFAASVRALIGCGGR